MSEFDPEYLAAIEREQQRLIWEEIARVRKGQKKRVENLKYNPPVGKPPATSKLPRTTLAELRQRLERDKKGA